MFLIYGRSNLYKLLEWGRDWLGYSFIGINYFKIDMDNPQIQLKRILLDLEELEDKGFDGMKMENIKKARELLEDIYIYN